MKKFKVFANNFDMGIFEGEDESAALEAYAQEAGYESVADMDEQLETEPGHDVYEVVEVEATASEQKTEEEKKMKKFKVVVNHFDMGIFEGEDEAAALEAWAQDAGYQSFADMDEQVESEKPDEYEVVEMDADALEAYAQKAGYASFAEMNAQLNPEAEHDVVEVPKC